MSAKLIREILARRQFGEDGRLEVIGDESEGRRKRRKEKCRETRQVKQLRKMGDGGGWGISAGSAANQDEAIFQPNSGRTKAGGFNSIWRHAICDGHCLVGVTTFRIDQ